MLTGPQKTIYDFALNELKLGLQDSVGVDSNFMHTDYIALLDKNRVIRGYYHGTDTTAIAKLGDDIVFLALEKKDKNRKSDYLCRIEFNDALPIVIILVLTAIGVVYFSRKSANPQNRTDDRK